MHEGSKAELTGRILAFSFLSRVFSAPPSMDWLDTMVSESLFQDWPLSAMDPLTRKGLEHLDAFCRAYTHDRITDLIEDYEQLFVGPGIKAPPWESVWLGKEHLLFEQETLDVRAWYAGYGLQAPRLNREPDDHLSLELDFVVFLSRLALGTIVEENEVELERIFQSKRGFFSDHLMRWAPGCLERAYQFSRTEYYRGAAALGLGTLKETARRLGVPDGSEEVVSHGNQEEHP